MNAAKQENSSAAGAAPLVDAAGWRVAAGDSTCVFVPGVAKPIACGSKERALIVAAAPDMLAALEYAEKVLAADRFSDRGTKMKALRLIRAALASTTA